MASGEPNDSITLFVAQALCSLFDVRIDSSKVIEIKLKANLSHVRSPCPSRACV
jgi:hypothetical protein